MIMNKQFLKHQLHGSARGRGYGEVLPLFAQFAAQEKPFMILKVMATRRRECLVPPQAAFFDTIEELRTAMLYYKSNEVYERGLEVMFVDGFEWDLGINEVKFQ
jgi:hypothetical protein